MKIQKPTARGIYFTIALITLLCGAAIYPLFRGPDLLIWSIAPKPDFWEMWKMPYPKESIPSVLVSSGPDFLWLLSGICVLRGLWYNERKMQKLYLTIFYIIAAGYNIGQYIGVIPGTFDLIDVLSMSSVALAERVIWTFFVRRKKNEKL